MVYKACMSHALNGSLAVQCIEQSSGIEMYNPLMFNFYTGVSHTYICLISLV